MVGSEFVSEAEDAMGAGFRGIEVVVRTLKGGEVFDGKVFGELFDREAGKIVGHSMEDRGFILRVLIQDGSGAD